MTKEQQRIDIPTRMWELLADQAKEMPGIAEKLISYIKSVDAACVVVCDRGARPVGFSIESFANKANIDLPPVHYYQISQTLDLPVQTEILAELKESLGDDMGDQPIVVIDDHMRNGGTKSNFLKACVKNNIRHPVSWVTLTGKGADLTMRPNVGPNIAAPWNDMPRIMGVDYVGGKKVEGPIDPDAARFYEMIDENIIQYLQARSD